MSKYKGKKVTVVGFGKSGYGVSKFLAKQGAKVCVTEAKPEDDFRDQADELRALKVDFEFGRHTDAFFQGPDMIVVSPGINPTQNEYLTRARASGVHFTSEIEIAASVIKEPLIAITGTNGKTTVTTLIGEFLKADNRKVFVGGNIGTPLIDYALDGAKYDVVVAELSSFQLDQIEKVTPACAVFTNIEPDHLDRYSDLEAYTQSKRKLLKLSEKNTYVVLNHDDPTVSSFAGETSAKVLRYTMQDPMDVGGQFAEQFWGSYFIQKDKKIFYRGAGKTETYDLSKFRLIGQHNRENLMAAICAARAMGTSPAAIQKVIDEFKGIPHRLEFIRKREGVFFFNDSKATNVPSVQTSIRAFSNNPIILIAGGRDKNQDFTKIQNLVKQKVKILILLGESKEKINRALGDFAETYLVGTYEEAVLLAYQKSRSGDIILLSPGCSSYDMFRNFEERGDYYRKLVQQI